MRTNSRGFFSIIVVIVVLVLVGAGFLFGRRVGGKLNPGLLPSLSSTPTHTSIKELIKYSLPLGWSEKDVSPDGSSIGFASKDAEFSVPGFLMRGATIYIDKFDSTENLTVKEAVEARGKKPDWERFSFPNIKISGKEVMEGKGCFEGCFDEYYFKDRANLWRVTFSCEDKDCVQKNKDLNLFLGSVQLL